MQPLLSEIEVFATMQRKGFWPNDWQTQPLILIGKLGLIATEIEELQSAISLENYIEELADIAIRCLDICGALQINIWPIVIPLMTDSINICSFERSDLLLFLYREVALAMEHYRKEPTSASIVNHMRSILILCWQRCQYFNCRLNEEIDKKMAINAKRPYRHGKSA